MESLFLKILNMSITASYVILALLFIRLLLKRAPKKYAYLLWTAVLFRLICPVSFSSAFSLFQMHPFNMTKAQSSSETALIYIPADIGFVDSPKVTVGIPYANSLLSESLPAGAPYANVNPMQMWIIIGAFLWFAGIAIMAAYNTITFIRLRSRVETAVKLDGNVYESDKIRSPFILGFFYPRIYIPFGLNDQERKYILEHEQVHLKRKDHIIKLLSLCVLAIHWFNPLVWIAYFMMGRDMEMSCDEKVLSQTGGSIVHEYSLSLLSFAANRRYPAASPLAFGEIGIQERIKNILRFKKPPKWVIMLGTIVCLTTVAACASNPAHSETAKEADHPFGNYAFERQIYMSPLSSFLAFDGYQEYYTLTKNTLIVRSINGSQQEYPIIYKKTKVDKQTFKNEFSMGNIIAPDLSSYRSCYQLAEDADSSSYRIFRMDDELWLARVHTGNAAGSQMSDYIWSIYKIKKFEGEFPVIASVYGTDKGVKKFLSLQGDYQTGYDNDKCYNITPEEFKQDSGYQIFKYDTSCASFLLYDEEIYQLGEWFGGMGVTSMALADLDSDGKQELYFTYSWGSGIHRSLAAYFDPVTRQIQVFDYTCWDGDMLLSRNSTNNALSLFTANISNMKSFTRFDIEKLEYISYIFLQKNGQAGISF